MKLDFKTIFTDPEFTVMQIGCWQYIKMNSDGGFWEWIEEAKWEKDVSPKKEFLIQTYERIASKRKIIA